MSRRVVSAVMVVLCLGALVSCALVPSSPSTLRDNSEQMAAAQMQHIADAIRDHNPAALKKLFSPRAREGATDLDAGLRYFLSVLPPGKLTWETQGTGSTSNTGGLKRATELFGDYVVSVNGEKYFLYFAYFAVNEFDPQSVGIYALGVAPRADFGYTESGAKKPFAAWASQFDLSDTHTATGKPGVYVPQK